MCTVIGSPDMHVKIRFIDEHLTAASFIQPTLWPLGQSVGLDAAGEGGWGPCASVYVCPHDKDPRVIPPSRRIKKPTLESQRGVCDGTDFKNLPERGGAKTTSRRSSRSSAGPSESCSTDKKFHIANSLYAPQGQNVELMCP